VWRRIGLAALVLALTSAALLSALLYTADAEFVAGALSRLLGRHVEIGAIAFRPGARLEVEIEQLRVLETAGAEGPALLEVEHAVGRQAWPRLLAGQLLPLDWVVHRPVLRLHAAGTGTGMGVDFAAAAPGSVRARWRGLVSAEERRSVGRARLTSRRSGPLRHAHRGHGQRAARARRERGLRSWRCASPRIASTSRRSARSQVSSSRPSADGRERARGQRELTRVCLRDRRRLGQARPRLRQALGPRGRARPVWRPRAPSWARRRLSGRARAACGRSSSTTWWRTGRSRSTRQPGRLALDVTLAPFEPRAAIA
jgi:hypothetical protein